MQRIEQAAVRTARAEHRRAHRNRFAEVGAFRHGSAERRGDLALRIFAEQPQAVLAAVDTHADGAAVRLDHRIKLLHDIERFHLRRKVVDQPFRQRIDQPELEHARLGERLLHILVARARCDKANTAPGQLDAVERRCLRQLRELFHALLDKHVTADRVAGHHDIFFRIFYIIAQGTLLAFRRLDDAL